jgi:hypothetical protein
LRETLGEPGGSEREDDEDREHRHASSRTDQLGERLAEEQPQVEREQQELQEQVDGRDGDRATRVAACQVREGDEPVGAGDEEDEQDPEPHGRVGWCEPEQPPDRGREHDEVADHHRADEPDIAERPGQVRERHLREGGVEQQPERRPDRELEERPGVRGGGAEPEPGGDRGHVQPELVSFEPFHAPSGPASRAPMPITDGRDSPSP